MVVTVVMPPASKLPSEQNKCYYPAADLGENSNSTQKLFQHPKLQLLQHTKRRERTELEAGWTQKYPRVGNDS